MSTIGLGEAADQCNVSKSSLRRKLQAGEIDGAEKRNGVWSIPIHSLVSARLMDGTTPPDDQPEPITPDADVTKLEIEIRELRAKLTASEQSNDDLRSNITDLRQAMRMLEAGPPPEAITSAPADITTTEPEIAPTLRDGALRQVSRLFRRR